MLPDETVLGLVNKTTAKENTVQFPKFPSHTQATERCIRLVTEAFASVVSEDQCDSFIRTRIESTGLMKTFETKSDFPLA